MVTIPSSFTRLQTSMSSNRPASSGQGLRVAPPALLRSIVSRQPTFGAAQLLAVQKEPEDARLTGGTRSLERRLLALNLYGFVTKSKAKPERIVSLPCFTAA
jgi:hypothetical protein